MPIKPHKGESQSEWMSRCVPEMIGTGEDKRPQEQAVAACLDIWRNRNKQLDDVPIPEDGESHGEYMDRCIGELTDAGADEDEAEDACQIAWEERAGAKLVHKQTTTQGSGTEFILSDATPDRFGDVIDVAGWDFKNFLRNPLALFNHNPNFPIGTWRNVRTDKNSLRGELMLAPEGTSERIDEIRRLVQAGILRAVSVGFRPIESKPLNEKDKDPFGPQRFTKHELVETSLVSIPANPNALAVVKSLHISQETEHLVFGKHAINRNVVRLISSRTRASTPKRSADASHGKHATSSNATGKGTAMSGLAARIQEIQKRLVQYSDELGEHIGRLDDSNVTDEQMQTTTTLNGKIAQAKKTLSMLEESERNLAGHTTPSNGDGHDSNVQVVRHHNGNGHDVSEAERERRKSFFAPPGSKEIKPLDYVVRTGVVTYLARIFNRSPEEICKGYEPYNNDKMRAVVDWHTRAAVNPALTTVTGWAAELVTQINADYLGLLQPQSVYPRLAARGLQLSFGRAGRINIPMRSATPTIAGSFVGEGMPIPVRRGAFTSQVLTPKKMAVITSWTKEIDQYSIPAIEGLLREAISDDTSVALDSVLLDSNAATTIRPAGLLNGVSGQTPTALGGNAFNAIIGDIKNLVGALVTSTQGNLRSPVFLMNPGDVLSASMIVPPNTGLMPFRDELARGTLLNIPVIDSGTVPVKTVILLDAADFVTVGGEAPAFDISDQATIHEEDTNPAPIVGGTGAGTAATPVRSLWQTDTLALRMIQRMNWVMRRTGMVSYVSAITW